MGERAAAPKEPTMSFAITVWRLKPKFPRTVTAEAIGRQLAKCAPSVGANYRASCNARSRAEFIARLGVVVEEAVELRAIFARSVGTARANSRSQRERK